MVMKLKTVRYAEVPLILSVKLAKKGFVVQWKEYLEKNFIYKGFQYIFSGNLNFYWMIETWYLKGRYNDFSSQNQN